MSLKFEWDPAKEKLNILIHGVGFDEAATVFGDSLSLTISDPVHSITQERSLRSETPTRSDCL